MRRFDRGERVEIEKSGPYKGKLGTVLLYDPHHDLYCVALDEPIMTKSLALLKEKELREEVPNDGHRQALA